MATAIIKGNRNSIAREARGAIRVEGIEDIQDRMAKIINTARGKQVKEVYLRGGMILRDQARRNAPYDPKRKKGTHLRDAIFANRGDENKPNVLVGVRYAVPGAPHAHLIEYGTSQQPARPFFRSAIVQAGAKVGETIKTGLLQIIEDATK